MFRQNLTLNQRRYYLFFSTFYYLSHIKIRYAPILFTHLYYIPRLFILYFYAFIVTCFTQNALHSHQPILFTHLIYTFARYFFLPLLRFTLFLPRSHPTNEIISFPHYQRLNALSLLLVNRSAPRRYSPQSTSPATSSSRARRQFIVMKTNRYNQYDN